MTTYRRIGAVTTAIDVLNFLAEQPGPVPGKDVATGLDVAYGKIMCHLATLEDARFVSRIGEHYELGQGAALLWAKKKAQLSGKVSRCRDQLNRLEG